MLLPFGVNQRYDLVLDCGDRLLKAQCKTGRLRGGAIEFRAVSTQSNMNRTRIRGYAGQVDLFIVHCPETEKTYVVHEKMTGLGYYVAGARKFGADGDFVTSPEISPISRTVSRSRRRRC